MKYKEFLQDVQHIINYRNISIEMTNLDNNETLIIVTLQGGMAAAGEIAFKSYAKITKIIATSTAYEIYNLHTMKNHDIIDNWK